jgi:hypothetical protein
LLERPRAVPRGEKLKGVPLGLAPVLPANIRLGWRGLTETNALAYYENYSITDKKNVL